MIWITTKLMMELSLSFKSKVCTKCKKRKDILLFKSSKHYKCGLNAQCKTCVALGRSNYRIKNKVKFNQYHNNWLKTNIRARLAHNLRCRLGKALHGIVKTGSAVSNLGCSLNDF